MPQQHQSFVGDAPHDRPHGWRARLRDNAVGRQTILSEQVRGQQAATLATVD
jgi:hypothetical protein